MSKAINIGVNNIAQNCKNMWIGVDNIARKAIKAWIGDSDGIARLFYSSLTGREMILHIHYNEYEDSEGYTDITYQELNEINPDTGAIVRTLSTDWWEEIPQGVDGYYWIYNNSTKTYQQLNLENLSVINSITSPTGIGVSIGTWMYSYDDNSYTSYVRNSSNLSIISSGSISDDNFTYAGSYGGNKSGIIARYGYNDSQKLSIGKNSASGIYTDLVQSNFTSYDSPLSSNSSIMGIIGLDSRIFITYRNYLYEINPNNGALLTTTTINYSTDFIVDKAVGVKS